MGAEEIKKNSRQLRGTLDRDLSQAGSSFSDENNLVLKFHGAYQQQDRDVRVRAGGERAYIVMVRAKIPGGRLRAPISIWP